MLLALHIENFAIVKQLTLDFSEGMTAFTGETGAGKSIMIDALMLVLGGRGDADWIRPGELKCDISAIFRIEKASSPYEWLEEHELLTQEDVILRRVIYAEGRSKSFINGQPFPLHKVKQFSEMLVHIHGQHEHQTLLNPVTHRQQLDHFAGHTTLLKKVTEQYKVCQQIKRQLDTLRQSEASASQLELLSFQIEELRALDLQEGEIGALNQEHQLLHHAKDYLIQADIVINRLMDSEDTPALIQQLHHISSSLAQLPQSHAAIQSASELIHQAIIQCEEAVAEVRQFAEKIPLDEIRLQTVEARLSALHLAARKYHTKVEALPTLFTRLQEKYHALQAADQSLEALEQAYQHALQAYQQEAILLRQSRQEASARLGQQMTQIIQELGMPKGSIQVTVTPNDKLAEHGQDKVEYLVCTNPGMPLDALHKIASGGELSRISLAIQMVTAQKGATPTLIFDEVDVGIGGATAALVGRLLRQLGERLQVFCVTHQPQVASAAHHHFLVKKISEAQQTFSEIITLSKADRIAEIARMLGGLTIHEQSLQHAQALLAEMSIS